MDKNSGPAFNVSEEMRNFTEKSVQQARQAFESFVTAAQHAVSTIENQAATARSSAKEVGELAMRYAERNISSSFEFAQKLLQAKNPEEVMTLHSNYVSNQIATLSEQAKELGRQAGKAADHSTQH